MYGYLPPSVSSYLPGSSSVNLVDTTLRDRDALLRLLCANLPSSRLHVPLCKQTALRARVQSGRLGFSPLTTLPPILCPSHKLSQTGTPILRAFQGPRSRREGCIHLGPASWFLYPPHVSCLASQAKTRLQRGYVYRASTSVRCGASDLDTGEGSAAWHVQERKLGCHTLAYQMDGPSQP